MALVKVDNYYITDLKFFLLKKYAKELGGSEYHLIKNRFSEKTSFMTESAKNLFTTSCIRKCIKLYSYGKKNNKEDIMRKYAVAILSIIDSM